MKINSFLKKIFCIVILGYSLVGQISFPAEHKKDTYTIGLLVMATGRYTEFLEKLFESADRFFLPNHKRIYFVFADGQIPNSDHIIRIEQKRLGWPYDTLMRFKIYCSAAHYFIKCDYLFSCDADMEFVDTVGDEILGDLVATRHPGFCLPHQRHDDYERNSASTAFVPYGVGQYYFAGGFYGGSRDEFLTLASICTQNIEQDLSQGIIARYHDETHLNRYLIDNPPTVVLSASYCFAPFWDLPFEPKLVAIHKNHSEYQKPL